MDKQKKIVLQYIIPAGTLVLFIGIITLKNFIFPEKVKVNREITMDIPDVNKKIEENKNIAYEQEREYHRGDRTTDFPILPDDSVMTGKKQTKAPRKSNKVSSSPPKIPQHQQSGSNKDFSPSKTRKSVKRPEIITNPDIPNQQKEIVFNSLSMHKQENQKNMITGFIHNTQVITSNSIVKLRIDEEFVLNNTLIPANSFAWGICNISNGRVQITIHSINVNSRLIVCNASVLDSDGVEGIKIFNAVEQKNKDKSASQATRKIGATLSSAAKALTGTSMAGQLAGISTDAIINATTEGTSETIKQTKISLTNNHLIYIKF